MNWIRRHWSAIALFLGILIVVVLIIGSARRGYLDAKNLALNKDSLAALNSVVAAAAILVAFSLSYFRFFFGRTFARRADVEVTVGVTKAPDGSSLHAISLSVKNIGTLTIHEPRIRLVAWDYLQGGGEVKSEVNSWLKPDESVRRTLQELVDPGETAHFHAVRTVGKPVWASSYSAAVMDRAGNAWLGYATTSGAPTARAQPSKPA